MVREKEQRKYPRIGYDMPLSFSLSVLEFADLKRIEAFGYLMDKSEEGMGLLTEVRLEPGHIIKIRSEDGSFIPAQVMWVGEIEGKYRVGVLLYK
jgi:hypothetical protein